MTRTKRRKQEDTDVTDSQKLSPQDRQEIAEGSCVNCGVLFFIITAIATLSMMLL